MSKVTQLKTAADDAEVASLLPVPTGYHILMAIPEVDDETKGGIIKPDMFKDIEQNSSVIGVVLAVGDQCYSDKERFPTGAWCEEGDFILVGAYKGTRFKIMGKEFRIINDDTPLAVVADPRGYSRA